MNKNNDDSNILNSPNSIYQIKITLREIKPPIWRRFQVSSNISLYKLHKIIQVLMGWFDFHLFEFKIDNVPFGIPDDDCTYELKDARRYKINKVLEEGKKARYAYDFGDGWEIDLLVEKVILSELELKHAVCIKGKHSGPPEDCGGPYGYLEYLELLQSTPDEDDDEETKERREWIGEDYDPEYFNLDEINKDLRRIR